MSSYCRSVKHLFRQYQDVKKKIMTWFDHPFPSFYHLWSLLQSDVLCEHQTDSEFLDSRHYLCQACRDLEQMSRHGSVRADHPFEIKCLLLPTDKYILKEYKSYFPDLQITRHEKVASLQVDRPTKEFLISVWLEDRITQNVIRNWTFFHCGSSMYILKEDNQKPAIRCANDPKRVEAFWYQLKTYFESTPGFFHGSPTIQALYYKDQPWFDRDRHDSITMCLDHFERSRIYTSEYQLSTIGQYPLMTSSRLKVEYEDGKPWVLLDKRHLERMWLDGIEYLPTLDFYGFILSLVHICPEALKVPLMKNWWDQMFREKDRERILENMKERGALTLQDMIEILDSTWICNDFFYLYFQKKISD